MHLILFFALLSSVLSLPWNDDVLPMQNCSNEETLWDKHSCQFTKNPDKYQSKCLPRRQFPGNATSYSDLSPYQKIKGVVVLFHGYSACTDAYDALSSFLRENGYITLVPTLPGHGIKWGYGCKDDICVSHGNNPSELPISHKGYTEYSNEMVEMVKEQVDLIPEDAKSQDFVVASIGLSVGGAVSLYASTIPGNPFTRVVNVNPFLVTSSPPLDYKVMKCQESKDPNCELNMFGLSTNETMDSDPTISLFINELKSQVLKYSFKQYDIVLNKVWKTIELFIEDPQLKQFDLFNTPVGWGDECFDITSRGGYCEFRAINLMALQSFVSKAVGRIGQIPKDTYYAHINSERDGPIRDGVSNAVINHLKEQGYHASRCNYPNICNLDESIAQGNAGNICGPPHSIFSHAENEFKEPNTLYWETDLFNNILFFLSGESNTVGQPVSNDTMKLKEICYQTEEVLKSDKMFENAANVYVNGNLKKFKNKLHHSYL